MMVNFPITSLQILLKCIPQRYPIIMVDRLIAYNEQFVTAGITVTADNIFVKDQQFQEPGLIEHMAQSVALHTGFGFYINNKTAPTGYIGSISGLKIVRLPRLNETVHTQVEIVQEFGGVTLVNIQSKIANELIASGQMKTVIAQ